MKEIKFFCESLRNLSLADSGEWHWLGDRIFSPVREEFRELADENDAVQLEQGLLAEALYAFLYAPGRPRPAFRESGQEPREASPGRRRSFSESLQSAVPMEWVEHGWTVEDPNSGDGAGLILRSPKSILVQAPTGTVERNPAVGQKVGISQPLLDQNVQPGWAVASRGPGLIQNACRLYMNVDHSAAPELFAMIVDFLLKEGEPFFSKVLADPAAFEYRSDCLVVIVSEVRLAAVVGTILGMIDGIGLRLGSDVPCLTSKIAPGIGFAHCPPDGQSFGMDRCALVARTLVRNRMDGEAGQDELLSAASSSFSRSWSDPTRPFLRKGSTFDPASHG